MRDSLCICRLSSTLNSTPKFSSDIPAHSSHPSRLFWCHLPHGPPPVTTAESRVLWHPCKTYSIPQLLGFPSLCIQAAFVDLSIFLSKVQTSDTRIDRPDRHEQAPQLTTPFLAPPSPPHLRPTIVAIHAERVHLQTSHPRQSFLEQNGLLHMHYHSARGAYPLIYDKPNAMLSSLRFAS